MDFSTSVLGTYTARKLRERNEGVVLQIGRDRFTRADLAHVDCFNFQAAATLSAVLNRALKVSDTKEVFETIPPSVIALPRIGHIAIAVLGAVFEIKGLGGHSPLESWVKRHAGKDGTVLTFDSIKRHEIDADAARAERRARKSRKATRRDKAHATRVDRFTARQGSKPS